MANGQQPMTQSFASYGVCSYKDTRAAGSTHHIDNYV